MQYKNSKNKIRQELTDIESTKVEINNELEKQKQITNKTIKIIHKNNIHTVSDFSTEYKYMTSALVDEIHTIPNGIQQYAEWRIVFDKFPIADISHLKWNVVYKDPIADSFVEVYASYIKNIHFMLVDDISGTDIFKRITLVVFFECVAINLLQAKVACVYSNLRDYV